MRSENQTHNFLFRFVAISYFKFPAAVFFQTIFSAHSALRQRTVVVELRLLFSCQEQKVVIFASFRPYLTQKLLKQGKNAHFYPC
jgi:hypothetical protein